MTDTITKSHISKNHNINNHLYIKTIHRKWFPNHKPKPSDTQLGRFRHSEAMVGCSRQKSGCFFHLLVANNYIKQCDSPQTCLIKLLLVTNHVNKRRLTVTKEVFMSLKEWSCIEIEDSLK